MTPPTAQAQDDAPHATAPGAPPTVAFLVLKTRAEFLKAASARRQGTASFLLQARDRRDGTAQVQVGFTASKKIGNAVARNRAKRRLRAAAQAILWPQGQAGWDYVLVARPEATVSRPWAEMLRDLEEALRSVHGGKAGGARE